MWQSQVMEIIKPLKIIQAFSVIVDSSGQGLEIYTIHSSEDVESDRFIIRKDPKGSQLFIVDLFKKSYPIRSCKQLTKSEIRYVVSRYCVPRKKDPDQKE